MNCIYCNNFISDYFIYKSDDNSEFEYDCDNCSNYNEQITTVSYKDNVLVKILRIFIYKDFLCKNTYINSKIDVRFGKYIDKDYKKRGFIHEAYFINPINRFISMDIKLEDFDKKFEDDIIEKCIRIYNVI